MSKFWRAAMRLQLWRDQNGRDLIEYVMLAAFLAVACSLLVPDFAQNMTMVISKIARAWNERS